MNDNREKLEEELIQRELKFEQEEEKKLEHYDNFVDKSDNSIHEDIDAVMRKYDKQSNVRIWVGKYKVAIELVLAFFAIWCIYVTLFATFLEEIRLTCFMGMIVLMGFIIYPAKRGEQKVNHIPWYDLLLMVSTSSAFFYFAWNASEIVNQGTRFAAHQIVIGIVGIIGLVEVTRRCVGKPILYVAGFFTLYALIYGLTNPDFFLKLRYFVRNLFYTKEGIFSTPLNVCSKYIVVFIIFGAFLERIGISNFFIELANRVAGRFSGGPAKVSVISSALCGMVSGSSVGNTVTTGSVTIPMMKKTGYKKEFAGAVEAASSTGGQIMPPIMGAAAFLMADFISIPYSNIVEMSILPAILYFVGIFICVHLEARRLKLKGIPKEELPKMRVLAKKLYLLLPLVMLVVWVSGNFMTLQRAAAYAIILSIIVSLFNKENRINPKKFLDSLVAGSKSTITVGAACGMAGIIAGSITMTGLANELINGIVGIAGSQLIVALVLTMVCCIVLGMGVPTTANYCIMAATTAPILIHMGVPTIAAHFFVFYFGIIADITPPVALAAYAAAAIAKGKPMKTAFNASKLAIAAFIVPYMFCFNPKMLLIDASWVEIVQIAITSFVGVFGITAALQGYFYGKISAPVRVILAAGGLLLIHPAMITDGIGLVVVGLCSGYQVLLAKRNKKKRLMENEMVNS